MSGMVSIAFTKKKRKPLLVPLGSNLMQALLRADIPVASSCHGDGVCAKCRLKVTAGAAHLTEMNETERFLRDRFALSSEERISCQVEVLGDIEVDATYW